MCVANFAVKYIFYVSITVHFVQSGFCFIIVFVKCFFFQPEKYDYTVIEGEQIEIHFTATVPVSCIASHEGLKVHCDQKFYIFQPEFDQQSFSCLNNIVSRDVVFQSQFCGISIGTNDWQETKTLDVYGFSDGLYNFKDRSTSIRISTGTISTFNDIWKNINIPDVKVCK